MRLVRIAIFVALIIVGAFVKFPIGIVPVSMQFAFCMFASLMLGGLDSFICVAIYIVMGLIGIPVFSAGGGFAYVLQPTFGYILGFLIAAPVGGFIARGFKNDAKLNIFRLLAGAFCSLAIVYTVGVMYMYLMLNFYVGTAMSMSKAWMAGCAVFLPTDCSWCVVGALVTYGVLRRYNPQITVSKKCIPSLTSEKSTDYFCFFELFAYCIRAINMLKYWYNNIYGSKLCKTKSQNPQIF